MKHEMKFLAVCLWLIVALTIPCRAFETNDESAVQSHEMPTVEAIREIGIYSEDAGKLYPVAPDGPVKNIIFCIGDGMGITQTALGRIKAVGADGRLYMERLPFVGIIRTHTAVSLLTDSAAAGTALATGVKTINGMVGVDPNTNKCVSILEAAKELGKASGLVVTCTIVDATPAVFAAHVEARHLAEQIAAQLLEARVDVMFGGGQCDFLPKEIVSKKKLGRKDGRNLIDEAKKAGYAFVETREELKSVNATNVLGLFALEALTTKDPEPTLAEMTGKAIDILSKNPKGFFLMVEGSQIDWACHLSNAKNVAAQVVGFDAAVKTVMDFAVKDGQTLVIITADHETGGLVIRDGYLNGSEVEAQWSKPKKSTIIGGASGGARDHSGAPVPLYAFGPHAQKFCGVYDNTDVSKKIAQILGITDFPKVIPTPQSETNLAPAAAKDAAVPVTNP